MSVCGKAGSWATSAVGTELTPDPSHCSSSCKSLVYRIQFQMPFFSDCQFICFLKALCTDLSTNLWGNSLREWENKSCFGPVWELGAPKISVSLLSVALSCRTAFMFWYLHWNTFHSLCKNPILCASLVILHEIICCVMFLYTHMPYVLYVILKLSHFLKLFLKLQNSYE